MDKNDKALRAVYDCKFGDFRPGATAIFIVNEADKAGAVREDGSIKFRMVVHLYLPE